jgi:hypothetical protein
MKPGPEVESEIQAGKISAAQTMGAGGLVCLTATKTGPYPTDYWCVQVRGGNPYPEDEGNARFRVAFKTLPSCDSTSQTGGDPAKGRGEVEADVDRIQGQKGANYDQRRDQTIFDCCDTGGVLNKSLKKDHHRQAPIGIQACGESDQKLDQILRTHWIFQTVSLATESKRPHPRTIPLSAVDVVVSDTAGGSSPRCQHTRTIARSVGDLVARVALSSAGCRVEDRAARRKTLSR